MAAVIYRSTDSSAPVLTGSVGSLITLLDACLVNGYGSKSAAGWTKPYTSTNAAVYRQGGSAPNRYCQVDDNGPGAALAKEARIWGYEAMTAYNTGTNLFPTAGQSATGLFVRKSTTADATARAWAVAADDRSFYLFLFTGDTGLNALCTCFGDIYSYQPADQYKQIIIGRNAENVGTPNISNENFGLFSQGFTATPGHYMARTYTGFGTSIPVAKHGDGSMQGALSASQYGFVGGVTFPNSPDGGLYLAPATVTDGTVLRGRLRGVYGTCHPNASFADGDTFSGTGSYAGRTFQIIKPIAATTGSGGAVGHIAVETTAWETSA